MTDTEISAIRDKNSARIAAFIRFVRYSAAAFTAVIILSSALAAARDAFFWPASVSDKYGADSRDAFAVYGSENDADAFDPEATVSRGEAGVSSDAAQTPPSGNSAEAEDTNEKKKSREDGSNESEKEKSRSIVPVDLSGDAADGELLLSNRTSFSPDLNTLLSAPLPGALCLSADPAAVTASADGSAAPLSPSVLILHTHATESYHTDGSDGFDPLEAETRSSDRTLNMVAVGDVLAEKLAESGIATVHCRELIDESSYNASYQNAAALIRDYLARFPSLCCIIDLHRDAITYSDGSAARPVTDIDGETAAQLMLLVGTDEQGAGDYDWETNLAFACRIQKKLNSFSPSLARPIELRGASYNEQYTPGSLLVEVGSWGNSLSEAKTSAALLGEAIAAVLLGMD